MNTISIWLLLAVSLLLILNILIKLITLKIKNNQMNKIINKLKIKYNNADSVDKLLECAEILKLNQKGSIENESRN